MQNKPKFFLKIALISVSLMIIGGYSYFEARNLIIGPVISFISPQDGTSTTNPLTEIKGQVKNISFISLNDKQIFTDKNGLFDEKLLLSPGYNIIKLSVKDRFGRQKEKFLQLNLKET
jgi:hypothetical protein